MKNYKYIADIGMIILIDDIKGAGNLKCLYSRMAGCYESPRCPVSLYIVETEN